MSVAAPSVGGAQVRREFAHPIERLVGLGVQDMQNDAQEKLVGGAVPMRFLAFTVRIHDQVRDVLDITNLVLVPPHLEEGIEMR